MKTLDVGCGSHPKGDVNVDLFIHPLHRGGESTAFNPKTIKNFVLADAHYLPFRDNIFQIVYSSHLLEHCLNPFKVLKELHRVSKHIVYLHIPYGDRTPDDCSCHLYAWTMKSFRNLLKRLFPKVEIYTTERLAQNLRKSSRWEKTLIGDLLLVLYRKIRYVIFWRTQITAICYKF